MVSRTRSQKNITIRDVVFNEVEMAFKKTDDVGKNTETCDEELEQVEIPIKVSMLMLNCISLMKSKKKQKMLRKLRKLSMTTYCREIGREESSNHLRDLGMQIL